MVRTSAPESLLLLVFVREALALNVEPALPRAEPTVPSGSALRQQRPNDAREWQRLWEAAMGEPGRTPHELLMTDLARLGEAMVPEARREWIKACKHSMMEVHQRFPNTPERALKETFQRLGVEFIVVLPVAGHYVDRHGDTLVLSHAAYADLGFLKAQFSAV